jgi:hypothetical protein
MKGTPTNCGEKNLQKHNDESFERPQDKACRGCEEQKISECPPAATRAVHQANLLKWRRDELGHALEVSQVVINGIRQV